MADTKDEPQIEITPKAEKEIKALALELKQVTRGTSILNENQVQKLFNSTNRKWKYSREGRGGQNFTYVRRGYMRRQLDSIFGFNWSFETKTPVLDALTVAEKTGSVVIEGRLTCVVLDERKQEIAKLVKEDYGSSLVKFQTDKTTNEKKIMDFGNDVKAARTDSFKRCAASLGIAADVYEKDEFFEIEIVGADQESDKTKRTEKLLAEAKAKGTINKQSTKVGSENEQPN